MGFAEWIKMGTSAYTTFFSILIKIDSLKIFWFLFEYHLWCRQIDAHEIRASLLLNWILLHKLELALRHSII